MAFALFKNFTALIVQYSTVLCSKVEYNTVRYGAILYYWSLQASPLQETEGNISDLISGSTIGFFIEKVSHG